VNGAALTGLMHLTVATRPLTFTATLPGTPASVSIARRLLRVALSDCPRADDLALAVTELAANAVAHSASGQGGSFTVRVRTVGQWARLEVTDGGPGTSPASLCNGWGLTIVASVTDDTGATFAADGRRTAWAEVTWPAAAEDKDPAKGSD
jgi:two-component sensor histidine kinase